MRLKTNIDLCKQPASEPIAEAPHGRRLQHLLYWLAGARKATLELLPESERERIAILGSSVLIPALLAFWGMYLYASHRFQSSRPVAALLLALAWAFVILNVDRILLATYRPFQPLWRKTIQVCFRVGLAAVISVAIAFPFCLEQYQGAIKERLQGEILMQLQALQVEERADRDRIETRSAATRTELEGRLKQERDAGPADPALYVEILAKQALLGQNDRMRDRQRELEQERVAAEAEWQRVSTRMREVEQDAKEEGRGRLAADRGGTGKPGQGAKFKELERELALLAKAEQTARQRYEPLLGQTVAAQSAEPSQEILPSLAPQQRNALLTEAKERKSRIDRLESAIREAEAERGEQLRSHTLQFEPAIKRYRAKSEGSFDPMEETIGLFKVIFVPETAGDDGRFVQRYKWMAALFQFAIVFGTLFLLDLIAILAKIMSRPGPYDVLVDFPETIARHNLNALGKQYRRSAEAWADRAMHADADSAPSPPGASLDLRNAEEVARFLLSAHLRQADASSSESRGERATRA